MLSYHRERSHWSQDPRFLLVVIQSKQSDILSKHWEHANTQDTVTELFDYQGDITLQKPGQQSSFSRRGVTHFSPF